ncbi:transposase family protein [Solwaraspora sp. WMMD937]|uniref:transposase family protein n=1 Tax=Solwaraspora sp. WMMD937 TaxID=3016090 RepID=UPI002499F3E5|nr:transposase family protein [Solwaraspora sp. WMMD937]WFE22409.1 transposase family protein [Solwaraspora sp. WMMD937]
MRTPRDRIRTGARALTCFRQALMVLVWFRKGEDVALLGAGFDISRATAYRYLAEGITVLTTQAEDLHTALRRVADDGWSHVILDCDRLTETTLSVKGETIDAWYSGKQSRLCRGPGRTASRCRSRRNTGTKRLRRIPSRR